MPETDAIYHAKEFDQFARDLRKGDEAAIVMRLSGLGEKIKKQRPGLTYFTRLLALVGTSYCVLDAETGISSFDGKKWEKLVIDSYNVVTNSRVLNSPRAKKMAAKSHSKTSKRPKGLEKHWKSEAMTAEREAMAKHWRDPIYKSAEAAIAACPDEELRGASKSMWIRIFDNRTIKH